MPYNTSYSDNIDVMEMANKFLRSVEKRKKNFSLSEAAVDSCSELSSLDLNDRASEKSFSLSDVPSKKGDDSASKTKVGTPLTETELKDLLSGIESIDSEDDSSSVSSSMLGFWRKMA